MTAEVTEDENLVDPLIRTVRCDRADLDATCVEVTRQAEAEYVAFLRGEDAPLPDWLWHLSRATRVHHGGGAALVQCGALLVGDDDLVEGIEVPPSSPAARPSLRDLTVGTYAVRRDLFDPGGDTPASWVVVPMLLVRRRCDGPRGSGAERSAVLAPAHRVPGGIRAVRRGHRPPSAAARKRSTPRLISVVIPVRDGAGTLPSQLTALARQTTTVPWEVLVVDNGSTDSTRAVAERARPRFRCLRIIDASDRPGESRARNRGIAAARGDFIAFCDADDIADPGWLAALAAAARENDLIGGSLETAVLSPGRADESPSPMDAQTDFLPFARGANCAAWKDVLTAVGGWDERYRGGGEDMDLSWRAELCGYRVGYAADAVMHYRLRDRLPSLARQKWNYGRSGARLFAAYRHAGFERRDGRTILTNWCWLLLHLPDLVRSPARRRRWVRYAARLSGFLAGSVRQGVRYL
ncbi:glycosyltransferase family 2 protein [Streptomyces calidiresistens]